ncbi:MAG: cytochrome c oxidase assembly protein [Marinobacterium sp.]|nr:cytochrome c oxidase assembly protein [Marinobacterium sp.]
MKPHDPDQEIKRHNGGAHRKTVYQLVLASVLMFGFGFALVPLYDVFCEVTGLNGKVTRTGPVTLTVDQARTVRVQMIAVNNETMPWRFHAERNELVVHPGEDQLTAYHVHNPTGRWMLGQAVPSVSPAEAAQYLHKINCFCFEQQPLQAQESRQMPLLFVVDPALPAHIHTITLSYTLFDITPAQRTALNLEQAKRRVVL